MSFTSEDLLQYAYYRCLPEVYRDADAEIGSPLYRYLSSIILGGMDLSLTDINNLLRIVDPEKCSSEVFPVLYNSFGLEYYPDIDIKYHRKFLMNYGELKKRKGTYSCIKFLARVLTSMDTKLSYLRGEYNGVTGRHLIVELQAANLEDLAHIDTNMLVVQQFVGSFVPYYITPHVIGAVATQELDVSNYRKNFITAYSFANIISTRGKYQKMTCPVLPLTNGVASGVTTQVQTVQNKNLCDDNLNTWDLTGSAYVQGGVLHIPVGNNSASKLYKWDGSSAQQYLRLHRIQFA